ncbi:MAG: MBL fold metallo-hydrolase [Actinomycetota bacterium]|nr:MBL fold metallo-hydrolase [Actinomycetota bacterium]
MQVTVIGCAGSFPGPDSPASCYLLEAEGFRLVIDMGNGSLGVLQRYAELFGIDAICLSHLHADHCIDLAAYWVARQFAPDGAQPPIPVYGPPGTATRVTPHLGPSDDPASDDPASDDSASDDSASGHPASDDSAGDHPAAGPERPRFDFHDLAVGTAEVGPFRITADRMNHPVETFGFRVEHEDWRLAYSADTGESDALVRLAEGADLLLCEASFLDGQDTRPNLHLTARQAAEHADRAGVGQLVLTHLVPWNDRGRSLTEASAAYHGPLSLASSGLVLGPAHPGSGSPPPAGR